MGVGCQATSDWRAPALRVWWPVTHHRVSCPQSGSGRARASPSWDCGLGGLRTCSSSPRRGERLPWPQLPPPDTERSLCVGRWSTGSCRGAAERLPLSPRTPVLRPPPGGPRSGARISRHVGPGAPVTGHAGLSGAAPSRGCPHPASRSSRASGVSSPICFVRVWGLLFAFSFLLCSRAKPKGKGENGFLSH